MKNALILTFFAIGVMVLGVGSSAAQTPTPTPAAASSVAGDWDASMETPGGARPFKLSFKVDGEKLSGSVKRNDGELPLVGTVKGKEITFNYTITYNGNALELSFAGTVNGDVMSGSVSFGGNGDGEWSAKRAAPVKPKT